MSEQELAILVKLLEKLRYEVDHYNCKEIDGVIETAKERIKVAI